MDQQHRASCGGILRNAPGNYLGGFAANLGFWPITMVEIWVAFNSLQLAWQEGYKQVILEMHSIATIALIQKNLDSRHPYACVTYLPWSQQGSWLFLFVSSFLFGFYPQGWPCWSSFVPTCFLFSFVFGLLPPLTHQKHKLMFSYLVFKKLKTILNKL